MNASGAAKKTAAYGFTRTGPRCAPVRSLRHIPRKLLAPRFRSTHHSISGTLSCLGTVVISSTRGISPSQTRAFGSEILAISLKLRAILLAGTSNKTLLQTTTDAKPSGRGIESLRPCLTSRPRARRGLTSSSVAFNPIAVLTPLSTANRSSNPFPQPMSTKRSSGRNPSSLKILRLINSVVARNGPRPARV